MTGDIENALHTTPMGIERIRRNLSLQEADVAGWCRGRISDASCRTKDYVLYLKNTQRGFTEGNY